MQFFSWRHRKYVIACREEVFLNLSMICTYLWMKLFAYTQQRDDVPAKELGDKHPSVNITPKRSEISLSRSAFAPKYLFSAQFPSNFCSRSRKKKSNAIIRKTNKSLGITHKRFFRWWLMGQRKSLENKFKWVSLPSKPGGEKGSHDLFTRSSAIRQKARTQKC